VRRVLGKTEEGKQYVINDYIIEMDGKSSQIDHILINRYGIFVIETKNYSGRIYGNDNQQEWTQVLQYGKVKHKLYNPVKQNATHIYRLKTVLGNAPFHSVVVFTQNNTHYITSDSTIPLRKLKGVISRGAPVLQPADMERIFATLTEHRSSISTRQHVQNIRSQSAAIESNICPRCGSPLAKRNGQYGTQTQPRICQCHSARPYSQWKGNSRSRKRKGCRGVSVC
jgi:hypothetical protein